MTDALYRSNLPHMNGKAFLTDGGLETTLVFEDGFDLPLFASFTLLESPEGRAAIDRYMRKFCEIAVRDRKGFVLDTPTWRASRRWATELGISMAKLRAMHLDAIDTLRDLRDEYQTPECPFVINGVIGPQDDGLFEVPPDAQKIEMGGIPGFDTGSFQEQLKQPAGDSAKQGATDAVEQTTRDRVKEGVTKGLKKLFGG